MICKSWTRISLTQTINFSLRLLANFTKSLLHSVAWSLKWSFIWRGIDDSPINCFPGILFCCFSCVYTIPRGVPPALRGSSMTSTRIKYGVQPSGCWQAASQHSQRSVQVLLGSWSLLSWGLFRGQNGRKYRLFRRICCCKRPVFKSLKSSRWRMLIPLKIILIYPPFRLQISLKSLDLCSGKSTSA